MLAGGEVHVAPGGPGVDGEAERRGGQRAPADGQHADEEHADEDGDAQAFLDELQPQEEFWRTAGFEQVQVNDLQVPGGVGDAQYLQVGHAFLPAGAVAYPHQGAGKGGGEEAEPRDGQREEPHVAPVDPGELLRAALQGAQDGEGNLVEHVAEHGGAHGGQLGAILVASQGGGGIDLADEEGAGVDIGRIQQAGGGQPAAQRRELAEAPAAEAEAGAPGADAPEEHGGEHRAGAALHHVGPHAPALPGQQQAQWHGHQRRAQADERRHLELPPRHVVRHVYVGCAVQEHDERAGLHQLTERRGFEKGRQPRGGEEEEQGNEQAHAQVEPEERVGIFRSAVLLADERIAESTGGQGARCGEEDGGEPHEPHFLLAQQAGQHHAVHQRDRLQGAFLQQHPPHAIGGLSGDSGHGGRFCI